ncbi:MAG: SRPBCC domain-containing protein [Candidatus Rokubacteria bacterium]|nr:SRPBCC domain-containing protein [Candidatus Rokubacteria bacterium]
MAKTILQTVRFNVPPERLYDIYTDSGKHSAATDSRASISRRVGGRFTAHDGWIRGKNLVVVPKRLIVQSWRGADWKKTELDSILILTFSGARGGARLTMVHANVPERWYAGISRGWNTYYWKRWRAYFRRAARPDRTR